EVGGDGPAQVVEAGDVVGTVVPRDRERWHLRECGGDGRGALRRGAGTDQLPEPVRRGEQPHRPVLGRLVDLGTGRGDEEGEELEGVVLVEDAGGRHGDHPGRRRRGRHPPYTRSAFSLPIMRTTRTASASVQSPSRTHRPRTRAIARRHSTAPSRCSSGGPQASEEYSCRANGASSIDSATTSTDRTPTWLTARPTSQHTFGK